MPVRRRHGKPLRRRIFVGVEGDVGFVRWLIRLRNELPDPLAILPKDCGGGSAREVAERAVAMRDGEERKAEPFYACVLLVDGDREMLDPRHPRYELDLRDYARQNAFELIIQRPSFEGLVLRLFPGHEGRWKSATQDSIVAGLRAEWPGIWGGSHKRPIPLDDLHRRFRIADLHRAAPHDPDLRLLLEIVGLWPPPADPPA